MKNRPHACRCRCHRISCSPRMPGPARTGRERARYREAPPGGEEGQAVVIPLGLFLGYLVATAVTGAFSWWLLGWLLEVPVTVAVAAVITALVVVAGVL